MAYKNTSTVRLKLPDTAGAKPTISRSPVAEKTTPTPEMDEGLFQELFEAVYDAVIITESNGRVLKTNGRARALFDYDRIEFFHLNIIDLISGADDEMLKTTREILVNERYVFIADAYCIRKDGELFPADVTINIIHISQEGQLCFFIRNVTWRKETEEELKKVQQQLLETAHSAGMAEIATGVLHDVGNVLNSVNVSCEIILEELEKSVVRMLLKANELMKVNREQLGEFITKDAKGSKLPDVYIKVGEALVREREKLEHEATSLRKNINNIKDVISTQQRYAKADYFLEDFDLTQIIDDALNIQMANSNFRVEKDYGDTPPVRTQRTKLVMIIMNLVANARDAMAAKEESERVLKIESGVDVDQVYVRITDNGEGISPENLNKIFNHGFTTKADGHGFGLHTSANLMTEMGGSLKVESPGIGHGASFVLSFPV